MDSITFKKPDLGLRTASQTQPKTHTQSISEAGGIGRQILVFSYTVDLLAIYLLQ
jgi:hypothetical protein